MLRLRSGLSIVDLGPEKILYCAEAGAFYRLNAAAAFLINRMVELTASLDSSAATAWASFSDLVTSLVDRYGLPPESARVDVQAFVDEMLKQQVLLSP